jgi:Mg2+/Co2+ transporter CorB
MIKEKISAVVVTRLGMMSGIITTEDLLKVLQRLLSEKKEGQSLLLADITSSPFFVEAIQEANAAGI